MSVKIKESELNTWADFILNHSLGGITSDDVVMIKGEHITWPLMSMLQDKIFAAGGLADINMVAPDNNRGQVWGASIAKQGTIHQIKKVPAWHKTRYEAMNKYIEILGAESPGLFANLPDETSKEMIRSDEEFKKIRLSKNWVLTLFPTEAFAQLENMTLEEYTDVIVKASTVDPVMLNEVEESIYQLVTKANRVTIETEHPITGNLLKLTMDISGRSTVKCVGHRNLPDGEVFTSPNADTVEGEIFIDLPVWYSGVTIEGIYLKIEKGIITDYKAEKGHDALRNIIETDEGSHRLGEVALGMNNGIQKALKHPLFVEKVGGTLHVAIGASYPECFVEDPVSEEGQSKLEDYFRDGKLNRSSQHVDIVADFRPGGCGRAIYYDETKLEIKDNIWVIP
jgi:aminopeptidase